MFKVRQTILLDPRVMGQQLQALGEDDPVARDLLVSMHVATASGVIEERRKRQIPVAVDRRKKSGGPPML